MNFSSAWTYLRSYTGDVIPHARDVQHDGGRSNDVDMVDATVPAQTASTPVPLLPDFPSSANPSSQKAAQRPLQAPDLVASTSSPSPTTAPSAPLPPPGRTPFGNLSNRQPTRQKSGTKKSITTPFELVKEDSDTGDARCGTTATKHRHPHQKQVVPPKLLFLENSSNDILSPMLPSPNNHSAVGETPANTPTDFRPFHPVRFEGDGNTPSTQGLLEAASCNSMTVEAFYGEDADEKYLMMNSPRFMSPSVWTGPRSPRQDIFSPPLGASAMSPASFMAVDHTPSTDVSRRSLSSLFAKKTNESN